jgi:hypothetical protein
MKVQGRERAKHFIEEDLLSDEEEWPAIKEERDIEGKGNPKWYKMLPYEEFVPHLPKLRYLRGAKAKFSVTTFEEINKVCQEIFECNKSFFRFRSQVDLLAHYIGSKILEEIYVVQKGNKKYPLSILLEEQEGQFKIWDQMKTVKEIFKSLCEKYSDGFMTQEELDGHVEKYVNTFDTPDNRIKMAAIIEKMIATGEVYKAAARVRKNYSNAQKAIEKGFHAVE